MKDSRTHLVLIPSYNTGPRLRNVVEEVLARWRPVLVVLDGCTDGSEETLAPLARAEPQLSVIVLPRNQGKGAAVLAGASAAVERGFTHGLVMDADGQHPADHIADFMAASAANPGHMVLGRPIFPSNIPPERLHGRKLSVGMVRFEIGGCGIDDPLFGFRVYPLAPLLLEMAPRRTGRRYDFDTESAVRLAWRGVRPLNLPAPVRYFSKREGGVSHFHYVRDNALLFLMHTRLVVEFLFLRWPRMRRHRRNWAMLAALATLGLLTPATPAAARAGAEPASIAEGPVDPAAPEWVGLLDRLAERKGKFATFIERRHFPFRKQPVELEGAVRISPEHGLSLHYSAPEVRTVILDDQGLVLRDARGDRSPPADARAAAATAVLGDVLRFDFDALRKNFAMQGGVEEGRWVLAFVPLSDAIRRSAGEIRVSGAGETVTRIELRRSAKQFVEILLGRPETRESFSAEEVASYFR